MNTESSLASISARTRQDQIERLQAVADDRGDPWTFSAVLREAIDFYLEYNVRIVPVLVECYAAHKEVLDELCPLLADATAGAQG